MVKQEKKKNVKVPTNQELRINKYGINLSEIIDSWFKANPHRTKTEVAGELFVTKMGFNHRLRNPYFGNAFDLLELSLATKHDFFQPFINVMKNNGLAVQEVYTDQQLNYIKAHNENLEIKVKRLERESDMLYKRIEELELKLKHSLKDTTK